MITNILQRPKKSYNKNRANANKAKTLESDNMHLTAWFAGLDYCVTALLLFITSFLYHSLFLHQDLHYFNYKLYIGFALLTSAFYVLIVLNSNIYIFGRSKQNVRGLRRSVYAWMAAFGLSLLVAFFLKFSEDLSRAAILFSFITGLAGTLLVRVFFYRLTEKKITLGQLRFRRAIIVGGRENVVQYLYDNQLWRQGYSLVGALYLEDLDVPGTGVEEFFKQTRQMRPDIILLVGEMVEFTSREALMENLTSIPANLCFSTTNKHLTHLNMGITRIGNRPAISLVSTPISNRGKVSKRVFDILFASAALIGLSPFFALLALAIKMDSKGPVFYRQNRQGFNGEVFAIWKFRSMSVTEADHEFKQAQKNDPRITKVGTFIRKYNLDELPQFINVLEGSMSVVGPRPHAIAHNSLFEDRVSKFARRHHVKPGITGWAQVNGLRGETNTLHQMRERVRRDVDYIEMWSLTFDIWIILLTIFSKKSYKNAG